MGNFSTDLNQVHLQSRTLRLVALCTLSFQVDSSETLSDSDGDGKALTEVHSIGVQVEDDKR